ncbi:MAG: PfkB family carbohydrate kinase [Pseudomonadota bacterium]
MSQRSGRRIAAIGAAHVDRTARALGPVAMGSSNPVATQDSFGGVAGNVARVAARLGADIAFIGLVGDDAAGRAVREALAREGIDTAGLGVCDAPTGSYTAFLDADGTLVVALADMGLYDRMTPGWLDAAGAILDACPIHFADANLPRETLAALLGRDKAWLRAVDAVSTAKAPRLSGLPYDLAFLNADEAAVLPYASGRTDPIHVVTEGAAGLLVHRPNADPTRIAAAPAKVVDVTGAGDALIGAALAWLAEAPVDAPVDTPGKALERALARGLIAAAFAIEEPGSLPDRLTRAALDAREGRET